VPSESPFGTAPASSSAIPPLPLVCTILSPIYRTSSRVLYASVPSMAPVPLVPLTCVRQCVRQHIGVHIGIQFYTRIMDVRVCAGSAYQYVCVTCYDPSAACPPYLHTTKCVYACVCAYRYVSVCARERGSLIIMRRVCFCAFHGARAACPPHLHTTMCVCVCKCA